MSDTPNTNKVFINSIPYVQDPTTGDYAVPVANKDGLSPAVETAGADGGSNTNNAQSVKARLVGFNGATWDRIRAGLTAITSTFTGFLNTIPYVIYHASPTVKTEGQGGPMEGDVNGNIRTAEQYAPVYEDNSAGVAKVEQRGSPLNVTADALVKSGSGHVYSITIMPTDAAATAGTIVFYDNTAESGTVLGTVYIPAAYFIPVCLPVNWSFTTGLYVGFTTTNDVNVTVSYR